MNYYYIDFENVKTAGLKGVDALPSGDTVKIFAKGGSDQMKFNDIKTLMNARASVVIDDVVTGTKNALDFQLLADLTIDCMKRAGMSPAPKFVIISADRGYDPAITQMRKRGINNVFRAVSIKDAENGTFCGTQTAKQQTQKQSPKKTADAKPEEEDQNKPQQAKPVRKPGRRTLSKKPAADQEKKQPQEQPQKQPAEKPASKPAVRRVHSRTINKADDKDKRS